MVVLVGESVDRSDDEDGIIILVSFTLLLRYVRCSASLFFAILSAVRTFGDASSA